VNDIPQLDFTPLPLGERGQGVRGTAPAGADELAVAAQGLRRDLDKPSEILSRATVSMIFALPRVKPRIPCPFSPKGRREIVVPGIERAQHQ